MTPSGGLNRLLKQLTTEDWLGPLVDAARPSEPERWEDPSLFVRPSAAGGPCTLDLQLTQVGHRGAIRPGLRALMDAGTQAHERITNTEYMNSGVLIAGEVRLTRYLDDTPTHIWYGISPGTFDTEQLTAPAGPVAWSGEADLIVRHPTSGLMHVGEIKKANSFRVKRLPPDTGDPEDMARKMLRAEPKYMRQLARYVGEFLEHFGPRMSDLAFFHWENANTQELRIIWVRVEPWLIEDARANADVAESATAEGRVVDFPFKKGSPTCSRCDRQRLCNQLREGDEESWLKVRTAVAKVNEMRPPTTARGAG